MNGKLAKSLRKKAAELVAAGQQQSTKENEYQYKTYNKVAFDLTGKPIQYVVYTATLVDGCSRQVYQELKKNLS